MSSSFLDEEEAKWVFLDLQNLTERGKFEM